MVKRNIIMFLLVCFLASGTLIPILECHYPHWNMPYVLMKCKFEIFPYDDQGHIWRR